MTRIRKIDWNKSVSEALKKCQRQKFLGGRMRFSDKFCVKVLKTKITGSPQKYKMAS